MPLPPTPSGLTLLPELRGRADALELRLESFPCRVDPLGRRRYPWPDFGNELLDGLWRALGEPGRLYERLTRGDSIAVEVPLRDLSPLPVHLSGRPPARRQLESDLADALLAALHSARIEP